MTRPLVLAFDMDGVLFDTESVKMSAFRDAFTELCGGDSKLLSRISDYNRTHRGIPRQTKIRYVVSTLLDDPAAESQVAARYADLLNQRLPACTPLPGVAAFLQQVDAVKYVASSAPVNEIERQLDRHRISGSFTEVFGHPDTKIGALRRIADRHLAAVRVFFGDAPADQHAAAASRTHFLAINAHPDLAAVVDEHFGDFRDGRGILAWIEAQAERDALRR